MLEQELKRSNENKWYLQYMNQREQYLQYKNDNLSYDPVPSLSGMVVLLILEGIRWLFYSLCLPHWDCSLYLGQGIL
jgi:hypothetical protein